MSIVFGVFIILHGIVHLLYFGQAARFFELIPGLAWPDGSWAFSRILSDGTARFLVSILLFLAGLGLIASGIGILMRLSWWQPLIIIAAILSALIFIFFWNGRMQNLDGQGGIGFLIDLWLLVMVVLVHWPKIGS